MGTPEFAVASLDILVSNGCKVVGVVTAPDRPAGRGLKVLSSPVKQYAQEKKLPVLQPEKLRSPDFHKQLQELQPNLFVVVAFRMLPEVVWQMPEKGTFNLHASLLPQYRGAAPINWAIINGEKFTGASTFFINKDIDTGDVIMQQKLEIGENETAGELHDRLMLTGAELVLKTVRAIDAGNIKTQRQQKVGELKLAPKIHREDCRIDWNQPAKKVHNFIRGLSPYPGAWTELNNKTVKVYRSRITSAPEKSLQSGSIITDNKTYLKIATGEDAVELFELQIEGRKRMTVEELLRGFSFKLENRFN